MTATMPAGLTAYVDQGREQRQSRTFRVRLVDDGDADRTVQVVHAEVASDRIDPVTWSGDKTFGNEADLQMALPLGRCGTGSDAEVQLTYRVDGGPWTTSVSRATDRYGQVALQLDRDCAERSFTEAASLTLGEPEVVGSGRSSVFVLPATITPTGARDDVAFTGFGDTVLFSQAPGSASSETGTLVPLVGSAPIAAPLRLVPARCDPHALAEDKVGTLIDVGVAGPGLPAGAAFYLALPETTRSALRAFFSTHCGL